MAVVFYEKLEINEQNECCENTFDNGIITPKGVGNMTKTTENRLLSLVLSQPWYKKILILRHIHGLSQKEAANKIGVDKHNYWSWENGVSIPRKRNRERIARVFGVSERDIFSDIYKE